jgi:predicted GNAT family N-acyltransferase
VTCIRAAETPQELEAIYRFRYQVYVMEMQRPQKDADHANRRIEDSLDRTGFNLAAWSGSRVVGIARANFARDGGLGSYDEFYDLGSVGNDHPWRTSIVTRLMVAPEHRHTMLPMMLVLACYRLGLENNIRWSFIDCNDHLVGFFTRLGFVQHLPKAWHPEYGHVTRMRLDLLDEAHLASVCSPFLGVLTEQAPSRTAAAQVAALDY